MAYLLFNADRKDFDDGEGNSVNLGEHLDYLRNYGGTPDCYEIVNSEVKNKAVVSAQESGIHTYIVNDDSYRVVGEVNAPKPKSKIKLN